MARDHYVPQFYLRNFQITRKPGHIYLYRRDEPIRDISIRKVAAEEDYYDLKRNDPEADKDAIDKLLLVSERTAAPIIKNLLSTASPNLTYDDIGYLSWFVALLGSRTPAMRETLASIHIGISNREFKKMLRDDTEFGELKTRRSDVNVDMLEKARKAFLDGDLRMTLNRGGETEDYLMGQQLQLASTLVQLIENRDWILMESASSLSFLTSDNPVIIMPVPGHASNKPWGYANGNILVPLSPKRALLFGIRDFALDGVRMRKGVLQVQRKRMPEIQFYIITQCKSAVFSHVVSKEFQRILDSTEEGKAQSASVPDA